MRHSVPNCAGAIDRASRVIALTSEEQQSLSGSLSLKIATRSCLRAIPKAAAPDPFEAASI
jgi:hypothetical protein